jgi:hypothetical protein
MKIRREKFFYYSRIEDAIYYRLPTAITLIGYMMDAGFLATFEDLLDSSALNSAITAL